MSFWYAKSDIKDAQIVLLGVPLEQTTTGIPGTRFGPDRIRAYSENVESYSPYLKSNLTDIPIADTGNLEFDYLPSIEAKLNLISQQIATYIDSKPLLIGGEHTLTLGAAQAMIHKYPDLGLLQLDAHADLRDVGESGSRTAHDTVMRRASELLKPNSLIQMGIRSFAEEELEHIMSGSPRAYEAIWDEKKVGQKQDKSGTKTGQKHDKSVSKEGQKRDKSSHWKWHGPKLIRLEASSFGRRETGASGECHYPDEHERSEIDIWEEKNRPIWLSLDLDVLDPSIMPAVGTPEPGGMSYRELLDLLLGFRGLNIVGADIVEFNPLAADFAAPAVVAANLVREICCLLS